MSRTFSQLVDRAVSRSLRTDRQTDIEDFVNQTIRELHADDEGRPYFYAKNLVEDEITTTAETQFTWVPPNTIQRVRTFQYAGVRTRDFPTGVYPEFRAPGRGQNNQDYYYYRAGTYFAFKGYGGNGQTINVAYYAYPKRLVYFATADRPATWDDETETFTYHANYSATAALKAEAEALVQNWVIRDWYDITVEGTMAKVFKLIGNTERAATHFSLFQRQRGIMLSTEVYETLEQ